MTPMKRPLAAASATVLLALSLSACGGAPTDASKADFCKVVKSDEGSEELRHEAKSQTAMPTRNAAKR